MDESLRIMTAGLAPLLLSAVIQVHYPFKEDFHFKGVPYPPRSAPFPRMAEDIAAGRWSELVPAPSARLSHDTHWESLSSVSSASQRGAEYRRAYYVSTIDEGGRPLLFTLGFIPDYLRELRVHIQEYLRNTTCSNAHGSLLCLLRHT